MMARISEATVGADNTSTFTLGRGAFQGAEGDAKGEDWYIENVKEELDAPREVNHCPTAVFACCISLALPLHVCFSCAPFHPPATAPLQPLCMSAKRCVSPTRNAGPPQFFFEAKTQKLFYFHNASAGTPPPAAWTFEVPTLPCLINISGTVAAPATGISVTGLRFTGAAASYMGPHGIPSGGDWGLSRMGAVLVSGAQSITIANNTFTRLDGNGVFLSGYTRNVTIDANEFVWMGESGVASWGYTDGVDATAGTQPWYTRFTNNLCHEIGMYEKQVSCYFAATSASAEVSNNIMYNMPRAAVNFNDDMAGGSRMLRNLIWNTCRGAHLASSPAAPRHVGGEKNCLCRTAVSPCVRCRSLLSSARRKPGPCKKPGPLRFDGAFCVHCWHVPFHAPASRRVPLCAIAPPILTLYWVGGLLGRDRSTVGGCTCMDAV